MGFTWAPWLCTIDFAKKKSRIISVSGMQAGGAEDHWAVRDQAARLVAHLCTRFSDAYYNMQPRISRTLLKALLDKSKPLTTHYGLHLLFDCPEGLSTSV